MTPFKISQNTELHGKIYIVRKILYKYSPPIAVKPLK